MNRNKYGIGTIGIASRNIETFSGKIQKGDRVQIVGIDDLRGYALLDLETGVKLTETGFDSITPARNGEIKIDIGTIDIASRNIETFSGKIQKGDRVQIVGIDDFKPSRGYALLDLETGVKLTETGFKSIIPARNGEIKFVIGTTGIASRDIETISGKIQKGDRVQIVGIDDAQPSKGYALLDLEIGVKITETGFDSIIPVVFENKNDMDKSGPTR